MGLGEKIGEGLDRTTDRLSALLKRRSAHAAAGLRSWIHHRPRGFLPQVVPGGAVPLAAIPKSYLSGLGTSAALELKALLALGPRGQHR